jgi:hypothetical protein
VCSRGARICLQLDGDGARLCKSPHRILNQCTCLDVARAGCPGPGLTLLRAWRLNSSFWKPRLSVLSTSPPIPIEDFRLARPQLPMIFPSDFRYDADGRIHLLGTDLLFRLPESARLDQWWCSGKCWSRYFHLYRSRTVFAIRFSFRNFNLNRLADQD